MDRVKQVNKSRTTNTIPQGEEGRRVGFVEKNWNQNEGAMLMCLQKLLEDECWKSIGRIFVLKVWPWVNNSWWILNMRGPNDPGAITDLNTQIGDKLPVFLGIIMNIPIEEWIPDKFRQEVFFTTFCGVAGTDDYLTVSERGTGPPIQNCFCPEAECNLNLWDK
jgi:hypothetical protein